MPYSLGNCTYNLQPEILYDLIVVVTDAMLDGINVFLNLILNYFNFRFVWRKKIEKDVSQGVPLDEFSLKSEKKRQKERKVRLLLYSCALFFLKSW